MRAYEVGQKYEEFLGHAECVQFDIADDGAVMLVFFRSPSEEEARQFSSGHSLEIRMTELYGVIVLTVKIGNLNWMDAPYSPHLSRNLTKVTLPAEGQGLACQLMLVDAATGELKHIRLLGFSESFTRRLFGAVLEQKAEPFDRERYFRTIEEIYSRYSSERIAKLSKTYCKF